MIQQSIKGYSDSISDLQKQLDKKSKEYMEVFHNNSIQIEQEISNKDEIQDLKDQIEKLNEDNIKFKSENDKILKNINDTNLELMELKRKHNYEVQQYISKLKENDKIIQERILLFDKDMVELNSKFTEIKDGLTKNMDSQLEQEKTKMKITTEE